MTRAIADRVAPAAENPSHSAPYDARLRVEGAGPPFLYVPGMDGTGQLFYRQSPALSRRFRVVTFRLRDEARSMDTLVEDVRRHLDAAVPGGERAIVMGESFGGALSMSFALAHPERVKALIVLNSFPWFAPQYRLQLARTGITLMPWRTMRVIRRLTAFRLQSPHTPRAEFQRFLKLTATTTRHGYLNRLGILRRYDIRDRLQELAMPTLFLAADRDHLIPSVEQARYMAARVPDAEMHVLRGHGHACLVAPDVNLDDILDEWKGWSQSRGLPIGETPALVAGSAY